MVPSLESGDTLLTTVAIATGGQVARDEPEPEPTPPTVTAEPVSAKIYDLQCLSLR